MSESLVPQKLFYLCQELAETLSTSTRTLHRLNSAGRIPKPSRLGGQLRWRRAEIDAWVDAGMPDRGTRERMRPFR
jgi:excisionase family DNA binding protein